MDDSRTPQIVEYIKQSQAQNIDEQTIRLRLVESGWPEEVIDKGFRSLHAEVSNTNFVKSGINLFKEPLNRLGFFLWTVVLSAVSVLIFELIISIGKGTHKGNYWEPFSLIYDLLFVALLLLAYIRRIQAAKQSMRLILLFFVPGVNAIFGIILLILPTKA
jgi:uncharacterized membrane protein YhaH (DUF805 family)